MGGLMETSATTTLPGSMSNNVETASERSRGTLTSNLQSTHVGKRRNSNVSLVNYSAHINEGTEVSMDGGVCNCACVLSVWNGPTAVEQGGGKVAKYVLVIKLMAGARPMFLNHSFTCLTSSWTTRVSQIIFFLYKPGSKDVRKESFSL